MQGSIPLHLADDGVLAGDLEFGARVLVAEFGPLHFGASLSLSLPTARAANGSAHYMGANGLTAHPQITATLRFGRFSLLTNLGILVVPDVDDCLQGGTPGRCLSGAAWRDSGTYAVAGVVELHPQVRASLELNGATALSDTSRVLSPLGSATVTR